MNKKFNYASCLSFLSKYAKKYLGSFLVFYSGCLLDYVLFIIVPIVSGIMLDQVVYYQNLKLFISLGIVQLSFVLFYSYIYYVTYREHSYLTAHFTYDIKSDALRHLFRCSPGFLSKNSSGELLTIVDSYSQECLNFFIKNVIHHFNNFFNIVFCMIYILIINWKMGLLITVMVPISVFISHFFGERIRKFANKTQELYSNYNGKLFEILSSVKQIKLLAAQNKVMLNFSKDNKELIHLKTKNSLTNFNAQNTLEVSQLLLQMLLYTALAYFAFKNEVTLGSILVILAYYSDVKLCVGAMVNAHFDSKNRIEYIKRLHDFTKEEEEDLYKGKQLTVKYGKVKYENVSFGYDNNSILENISVEFLPNKKIGIVGKSGCGKSTLVYLLLNFFKPSQGKIFIEDIDINELSLHSLRENIGIVFQETVIFNTSIRENISMGMKNVSDEQILNACKKAGIYEFVLSLPEQLDTIIGETGRGVSGGQGQRIAVARLYLQNPPIVIFDESTSSLDKDTEREVLLAWEEVLAGKTAIVIAHRLDVILKCDEAIVIKEGKIVECGIPDDLLQTSSCFNEIFLKEDK